MSKLTDNLVSYWKLDETSGNAADSVGSNTLTNTGVVYNTSGKINNGAVFVDSENDKLTKSGPATVSGASSVAGWIYPTALSDAVTRLFWNSRSPTDYGLDIQIYDSKLRFDIGNGSSWLSNTDVTYDFVTNTWYHIVFAFAATNSVDIYINGVKVNTTAFTGTPLICDANHDIYLGSESSTTGFDGTIDEVGLWSRQLTQNDVEILYNKGFGRTYPFNVPENKIHLKPAPFRPGFAR